MLPLCEFERYFAGGASQLWERQALTRTRVIRGEPGFTAKLMDVVHRAMLGRPWRPQLIDEIRTMRGKVESAGSPRSLKRGPGGLVDVEFLVQMLQLKYGREHPAVIQSNIWEALDSPRDR